MVTAFGTALILVGDRDELVLSVSVHITAAQLDDVWGKVDGNSEKGHRSLR